MKNILKDENCTGTDHERRMVFAKYALQEFLRAPGKYMHTGGTEGLEYVALYPWKLRYAMYRLLYRLACIYDKSLIYKIAGYLLLSPAERKQMETCIEIYKTYARGKKGSGVTFTLRNSIVGEISLEASLYLVSMDRYMRGNLDHETCLFWG